MRYYIIPKECEYDSFTVEAETVQQLGDEIEYKRGDYEFDDFLIFSELQAVNLKKTVIYQTEEERKSI